MAGAIIALVNGHVEDLSEPGRSTRPSRSPSGFDARRPRHGVEAARPIAQGVGTTPGTERARLRVQLEAGGARQPFARVRVPAGKAVPV